MEDMTAIVDAYEEALSNSSFVNREVSAGEMARNAALALVMNRHHVVRLLDVTPEMTEEARRLYLSAIGE